MHIRKIAFSIFILLVGCSQKIAFSVGDGGLLSDQPCKATCFFNITPGITSEYDFSRRIRGSIFASCQRYDYSSSGGGNKGYRCHFGSINIKNGIVQGIIFNPSVQIKLGDVIAKFSNPQGVSIIQNNILPEEPINNSLKLYYDNPCIALKLKGEENSQYIALSDSLISTITYFDEYLCSSNQITFDYAWKGYGVYP